MFIGQKASHIFGPCWAAKVRLTVKDAVPLVRTVRHNWFINSLPQMVMLPSDTNNNKSSSSLTIFPARRGGAQLSVMHKDLEVPVHTNLEIFFTCLVLG